MTSTPTPTVKESLPVPSDPVAAIQAALAAGPTPGIWEVRSGKRWHHVVTDRQMFGNLENWRCVAVADEDGDLCAQDAAFIAACNPVAIAALLAQLEAAQKSRDNYIDMYMRFAEAMEYSSGKDGLEWSPEEWAAEILRKSKLYDAALAEQQSGSTETT